MRDNPGQDYADQRYYNVGTGRFNVADPGGIRTADSSAPASWNRFAYVQGDPINQRDVRGLYLSVSLDGVDVTDYGGMGCDDGSMRFVPAGMPPCFLGGGGGMEPEPQTPNWMRAAVSCELHVAISGMPRNGQNIKGMGASGPDKNQLGGYDTITGAPFDPGAWDSQAWAFGVQIQGNVYGDNNLSDWYIGQSALATGTVQVKDFEGELQSPQTSSYLKIDDWPKLAGSVLRGNGMIDWLDAPGLKRFSVLGNEVVNATFTNTLRSSLYNVKTGDSCNVTWKVTVTVTGGKGSATFSQ